MNYSTILNKQNLMPIQTFTTQAQQFQRQNQTATLKKLQNSRFLSQKLKDFNHSDMSQKSSINKDLITTIQDTIKHGTSQLVHTQILDKTRLPSFTANYVNKIFQTYSADFQSSEAMIIRICADRNLQLSELEKYIQNLEAFPNQTEVSSIVDTPTSQFADPEVIESVNSNNIQGADLEVLRNEIVKLVQENNDLQQKLFDLESEIMLKELE
ncbi:hypothetical protein SS50377_28153 [Spironucleus salmonicida]|uniref:Uncharacterized protein n=1 Tax=Spironucleus salmonicida TaxID=348837 RepID=V6LSW7_9EUKA|nr:hypothetical protein SS50377_28153 [Spironucleus salmonicida]|eukprot:EST47665.1 Hypothetical protein SS50377_12251 [Spironucleus salmonicida]